MISPQDAGRHEAVDRLASRFPRRARQLGCAAEGDDRPLGQAIDQPRRRRVAPGRRGAREPLGLERGDLLRERLGQPACLVDRGDEERQPLPVVAGAEGGQAAHIRVGVGGEHEGDRREHRLRRHGPHQATAAQDELDQRSPDAAVAVGERMDGLELDVATAAWSRGGRSSRSQNRHRSSRRRGTSSSGGGTNAAPRGLPWRPPIQFWLPRMRPAIARAPRCRRAGHDGPRAGCRSSPARPTGRGRGAGHPGWPARSARADRRDQGPRRAPAGGGSRRGPRSATTRWPRCEAEATPARRGVGRGARDPERRSRRATPPRPATQAARAPTQRSRPAHRPRTRSRRGWPGRPARRGPWASGAERWSTTGRRSVTFKVGYGRRESNLSSIRLAMTSKCGG